MKKILLTCWMILALTGLLADELSVPTSWRLYSGEGQSSFKFENGALDITMGRNFRNDGYIEKNIPLIRRGILTFDLETPPAGAIGLFMELYNITVFWHGHCKDWRSYFPEPNSRRLPAYDLEPVGHRFISPVKNGRKASYKIIFDADADRVEYYKDNMEDPARIDSEISVLGRSEYRGGILRIGSIGFASQTLTYRISNLKLSPLENCRTQPRRDKFLIFRGMSYGEFHITDILKKQGVPADLIRHYTLQADGFSLLPVNRFVYSLFPGQQSLQSARCIIFVDAPGGPPALFPTFLSRDLVKFVREGGRLVLFGGLFTLEKGEFQGTPLEEILPVKLSSPFGCFQKTGKKPWKGRSPEFSWISAEKNLSVEYLHMLPLADQAEVLITAGRHPVLVRRKAGRGEVLVFLGAIAGRHCTFWQQPSWERLAAAVCGLQSK